jgi:GTP-binding protein HflX
MENIFITGVEQEEKARAVLVSVFPKGEDPEEHEASLDELERLLETAGGECFARLVQNKEHPDNATYIGSGKLDELKTLCNTGGCELVIFDAELSPSQIRNIEKALGDEEKDIMVIDRSMLILDIFALHAVTGEGKAQVELAQIKYTSPRLIGKGKQLSRLGGGIGTRGPGESKLEQDRRHLARRAAALEKEIAEMARSREVQRKQRDNTGMTKIAIAGYTNAGKSTLLNRLTEAGILAEDKLFATLDTTTRKYTLPGGVDILLTDTVGFIRNLPHHLIKAFRSTLEEVVYSDLLIIIIDASDPEFAAHLSVTEELLSDLGAADKPKLYVMNKCDAVSDEELLGRLRSDGDTEYAAISAKTGLGVDEMILKLEKMLGEGMRRVTFNLPMSGGGIVNDFYNNAENVEVEYTATGISVTATVDDKLYGKYQRYVSEE